MVPLLYRLLQDKDINTHNNKIYRHIQHNTIKFVEDSLNMITFKDTNYIKEYVETYYQILHDYYNCNKLKINPDKIKYIIVTSNKIENHFENIKIVCKKI